jgi:hypothetical protein
MSDSIAYGEPSETVQHWNLTMTGDAIERSPAVTQPVSQDGTLGLRLSDRDPSMRQVEKPLEEPGRSSGAGSNRVIG